MSKGITNRIRQEQEWRTRRYPKDRIPFLVNDMAATEDKTDFREYIKGRITLKMLCIRIARTNRLPHVSEEAMLNELRLTGWIR